MSTTLSALQPRLHPHAFPPRVRVASACLVDSFGQHFLKQAVICFIDIDDPEFVYAVYVWIFSDHDDDRG